MDTATHSKVKFGVEKQEHLVKLAILTIAAILCESKINYYFIFFVFRNGNIQFSGFQLDGFNYSYTHFV